LAFNPSLTPSSVLCVKPQSERVRSENGGDLDRGYSTRVMDDNNLLQGLLLSESLKEEQVGQARFDSTACIADDEGL
jgi:hypothetical protein